MLVACTGCSSILGIDDFKLGDAGTDGGDATPPGSFCLGADRWQICLPNAPTNQPITISSSLTLDTELSTLCANTQPPTWLQAGQAPACFVISTDVTFNGPMTSAQGGRPLVVFASKTITINTQLDVSSHIAAGAQPIHGAGSAASACGTPTPATNATGAGGGAGGSFVGRGGDGGRGAGTNLGGVPSPAEPAPGLLRAGCTGGAGGNAQSGGIPGFGGGAVYLVAGERITIDGLVAAGGAAGAGGGPAAGGGGGGSGGMIVLYAPAISGTGRVFANGGGGGGGGDSAVAGQPGSDAQVDGTTAAGGAGGPNGGGIGGPGTGGTALAGGAGGAAAAGVPNAAGGGGGGGAGYIRSNVTPNGVAVSPPATIIP